MVWERLISHIIGAAIGADDVLRPSRLQIICGSAMRKQDRPKRVKSPCARLRIATTTNSIGKIVAVCIAVACDLYIVAWPGIERDEKDTELGPGEAGVVFALLIGPSGA